MPIEKEEMPANEESRKAGNRPEWGESSSKQTGTAAITSNATAAGSVEEWQLWCRLCAKVTETEGNINIFLKNEEDEDADAEKADYLSNRSLVATIEKFFWLQLSQNKDLPRSLCSTCFSLITSLVNFQERVSKVQQLYEEIVKTRQDDNFNLWNVRMKYGLIDEEQREEEVMITAQPLLTEVHYLDTAVTPGEKGKIKNEVNTDGEYSDDIDDDDNGNFETTEDPFNGVEAMQDENQNAKEPPLKAIEEGSEVDIPLKGTSTDSKTRPKHHRQSDKTKRPKKSRRRTKDEDTNAEVLECTECPRRYKSSVYYLAHMKRAHNKDVKVPEAPTAYICEECGITVRTNSLLKSHMLTHTDYAPYECRVCKKRFKCPIRLKNHAETHDPNKHICAECGMQLNTRATLNRHLLVHSDKMQHKCSYCGREFKRAKALKNHLILHTGLKPYSCDICDRTFANGSNCRSHKKKAHPEELAAQEAAGETKKKFTPNIPSLDALRAITQSADNLAPVVTKASGCFSFGKKPKPSTEEEGAANKMKAFKKAHSTGKNSKNVDLTPYPRVKESNSIPTIDNIYSHILKRACLIKESPSRPESSLDAEGPPIMEKSTAMEFDSVNTLALQHQERQRSQGISEEPHQQLPTNFYSAVESGAPKMLLSPSQSQAAAVHLNSEDHSSNSNSVQFYSLGQQQQQNIQRSFL